MAGQVNISGTTAAVQLQGNDAYTTDRTFTFPDQSGELMVVDDDGNTNADNINLGALNGSQLAGFRNQIINGDFRIWQRGLISGGSASRYTADRWKYVSGNVSACDLRRVDNPITGAPFDYAMQYTGTDLGTNGRLNTYIELPEAGKSGPFVQGSTWTASFYVEDINQLNPANVIGLSFVDSSDSAANVVPFPKVGSIQDLGNNRYAFTFTAPAVGATNLAVIVGFFPAVGSGKLVVTGVQLEPGPVATPFEHRPIGTELALCQRYYNVLRGLQVFMSLRPGGSDARGFNQTFPATMRTTPTIGWASSTGLNNLNQTLVTNRSLQLSAEGTSTSVSGHLVDITADAEL
jgi:hypothetical protein